MNDAKLKKINRLKRHKRGRAKVFGTAERPRVSVFKSNKNIFVQFINDETGKTIISNNAVPLVKSKVKITKIERSAAVGELLGGKAKGVGIKEVVFDKSGFKYHGRIKAVADSLRKAGIKF